MNEYQIVLQGGAIAVFLMVFTALLRGHLRTQQEVEAWRERAAQEVHAWRERALRAEGQVDNLVPAVDKLTTATERQTDAIVEMLRQLRGTPPSPARSER